MEYILPKHMRLNKKDMKGSGTLKKRLRHFVKGLLCGVVVLVLYIILTKGLS